MLSSSTLADRRGVWAFVLGVVMVTAGVLLHLPMYWMGRDNHFHLAGMPMGNDMLVGMGFIILGIAICCYGMLPKNVSQHVAATNKLVVAAPEDAQLSAAHWKLMAVLVVALVIDIMKPASLGFALPGMKSEYEVSRAVVSLFPFSALVGTVLGSFVWGWVADIYGRKASILLSAVMFVGTSICGAMPSLAWNVGMCFMMGAAAGGMLPVTYALLAEMMPSRHRGWSLVLVGGLGAVGGYSLASSIAAELVPVFSWRILWLANLPTGLLLVVLGIFIPESAKFLMARGRTEEARQVMQRFGSAIRKVPTERVAEVARGKAEPLSGRALVGKVVALSLVGICWGLVNFGLLLWLPTDLVAKGYSMELSSKLLAMSSFIALPTVFLVAWMYSAWSTKWSLVTAIGITVLGLLWIIHLDLSGNGSPVFPVALLIIGSNGVIAMVLPYAAESFPLRIRGRSTGWVAGCTKLGGVLAQSLSMLGLIPALWLSSFLIAVPTVGALALVAVFGKETRGRDLRDLDPDGHTFDASGL
jgi:MFS transporter, putative metabolite:H+ symporter